MTELDEAKRIRELEEQLAKVSAHLEIALDVIRSYLPQIKITSAEDWFFDN